MNGGGKMGYTGLFFLFALGYANLQMTVINHGRYLTLRDNQPSTLHIATEVRRLYTRIIPDPEILAQLGKLALCFQAPSKQQVQFILNFILYG